MVTATGAVTRKKETLLINSKVLLYLTGCHWILQTVEFWIHLLQLRNYEKDTKLRKKNEIDGLKL